MRTMITAFLVLLLVGAPSVRGQVDDNCLTLLRLSRTTSRTVMDQEQFSNTIRSFCEEYRRDSATSSSLSLDLRTLGLGAGGGSNASANSLYNKFCRTDEDESHKKGNFEEYLEGVAPGAFEAYRACVDAKRDGVQINMLGQPTRDHLEMRLSYVTSVGTDAAQLSWRASPSVNCHVDRGGESDESRHFTLSPNERVILACTRNDPMTPPLNDSDHVTVIRRYGDANIRIPWQKYNEQGQPILTITAIAQELDRRVQNLQETNRKLNEELTALRERVEVVNGRFGLLQFELKRKPYDRMGEPALCPQGWIGTDVFANTHPNTGPDVGGELYRLCLRVGEQGEQGE